MAILHKIKSEERGYLMQHFYKHVLVELDSMRFYIECADCGKRVYAGKLPLMCRSQHILDRLEQGKTGGIRQWLYNHKKAVAVQHLARYFNQCSECCKWVCDDCYNPENEDGTCQDCTSKRNISI